MRLAWQYREVLPPSVHEPGGALGRLRQEGYTVFRVISRLPTTPHPWRSTGQASLSFFLSLFNQPLYDFIYRCKQDVAPFVFISFSMYWCVEERAFTARCACEGQLAAVSSSPSTTWVGEIERSHQLGGKHLYSPSHPIAQGVKFVIHLSLPFQHILLMYAITVTILLI